MSKSSDAAARSALAGERRRALYRAYPDAEDFAAAETVGEANVGSTNDLAEDAS